MNLGSHGKGVYVIAPTPFLPGGALDCRSVACMTEHYVAIGAHGLTVLGLMGEAPKLEHAEAISLIKGVIDHAAGCSVVVGVSAPGFSLMRRLAQESMAAGAAGVMITPPGGMRTDIQIRDYFHQAIAQIGADIPFVLQDHPTATGVVMSSSVLRDIIQDHTSCVMLKHEDWPGLEKLSQLRAWETEGKLRRVPVLCGNGALFLDLELVRGADGAMTGYAFPEMLIDVVSLTARGERDEAQDLYDSHLPLLRYEHQAGIGLAVRKHVLARRGFIAHACTRAPGPAMSSRAVADVEYLLTRLARRDPRAATALLNSR